MRGKPSCSGCSLFTKRELKKSQWMSSSVTLSWYFAFCLWLVTWICFLHCQKPSTEDHSGNSIFWTYYLTDLNSPSFKQKGIPQPLSSVFSGRVPPISKIFSAFYFELFKTKKDHLSTVEIILKHSYRSNLVPKISASKEVRMWNVTLCWFSH